MQRGPLTAAPESAVPSPACVGHALAGTRGHCGRGCDVWPVPPGDGEPSNPTSLRTPRGGESETPRRAGDALHASTRQNLSANQMAAWHGRRVGLPAPAWPGPRRGQGKVAALRVPRLGRKRPPLPVSRSGALLTPAGALPPAAAGRAPGRSEHRENPAIRLGGAGGHPAPSRLGCSPSDQTKSKLE